MVGDLIIVVKQQARGVMMDGRKKVMDGKRQEVMGVIGLILLIAYVIERAWLFCRVQRGRLRAIGQRPDV